MTAIPHRYVRRKDNPLIYIQSGHTDFSINGVYPDGAQFDTSIYEQVEGPLPEGMTQEIPPIPESQKTLDQKMEDIFMIQHPAIRAVFYPHKVGIKEAFKLNDLEAIQLLIESAPIPDTLPIELQTAAEQARSMLLALLPSEG